MSRVRESLCYSLIYLHGGCEEVGEARGLPIVVVVVVVLDWAWLGWFALGCLKYGLSIEVPT